MDTDKDQIRIRYRISKLIYESHLSPLKQIKFKYGRIISIPFTPLGISLTIHFNFYTLLTIY
jgi:hypothetical protein